MPLVARYGAATVAMTIDEEGMAQTAERKLEVARRIAQIANDEYGVPHESMILAVLTFPITTGQDYFRTAAIETIEGIRAVKQQISGCFTVLGVSNLSFGVAPHARAALNSVFLKHAVDAGLDTAIINPAHVTPYAEIPADQIEVSEALFFNRREDALARFIQFYEENAATEAADAKADPTEGMTVDQRTHWKIVHRKKEAIEADIDEAIEQRMDMGLPQGEAAVETLNAVLLPAMKEVGDKFGAGELILPFVLQSAEVMKKAVAHLEQYLEKAGGTTKGTVVLATVFGDVHDIGKNLVNTILTNNGYTVHDLGKQVPLNTIIDKAVEVDATAIGLSALLVSTSKQMPLAVKELHHRRLGYPVLVGGAAINRAYGRRIIYVDDETRYQPGVFYCKDAFEGRETMARLTDGAAAHDLVAQIHREAEEAKLGGDGRVARTGAPTIIAKNVRPDVPIPTP